MHATSVDGRWAGESKWRMNLVDLNLQELGFRYAARFTDNPNLYVLAFDLGPAWQAFYLELPLDTGLPVTSQLVPGENFPYPFPWILPVEPDH